VTVLFRSRVVPFLCFFFFHAQTLVPGRV